MIITVLQRGATLDASLALVVLRKVIVRFIMPPATLENLIAPQIEFEDGSFEGWEPGIHLCTL
jgi:hypothetical protein